MVKLTVTERGVRVPVLVEPGGSRQRLYGEHDGRLKLSVAAAPDCTRPFIRSGRIRRTREVVGSLPSAVDMTE